MATPSKLYAWLLAVSLFWSIGCGEKPHVPQDDHWTSQYSEFHGVRAAAEYDTIFEVMLTNTRLENGLLLEAPSLGTAIEILKSTAERSGSSYKLDYTIVEPDYPPFQKLIELNLEPMTLGEAINTLLKEVEGTWDFSAGVLTLKPKAK